MKLSPVGGVRGEEVQRRFGVVGEVEEAAIELSAGDGGEEGREDGKGEGGDVDAEGFEMEVGGQRSFRAGFEQREGFDNERFEA